MDQSLSVIEVAPSHPQQTLQHALCQGLSRTPKQLPCRFFYDEIGSHLFERICQLEEYYPTRTEHGIIAEKSDAVLEAMGPGPIEIVELGSGSSCKTRLLIEAALRRQAMLHYTPIDISGAFLRTSAETLLFDYPTLSITAIAAEYRDALRVLPEPNHRRLFLCLGGNIGNFEWCDAMSLLEEMRLQMRPGDRLLVGADRVKDINILIPAYNDSEGVTAEFNKNLLARINRELGADFILDLWEHAAPYRTDRSRIEMWLFSQADQIVTIDDTKFHFKQGEGIHTENSHKYTPESFTTLCHGASLEVLQTWTDPQSWFSVNLLGPEEDY